MIRSLFSALAIVACAVFGAPDSAAQDRLTLTAEFEPATAKPGDSVVLKISGAIDAGYHTYGALEVEAEPTEVVLESTGALQANGKPVVPPGEMHEPMAGYKTYWIEKTTTFTQKFDVPADAADGAIEVKGLVKYMACTEAMCDPPNEARFAATLTVGNAAAAPAELTPMAASAGDPFAAADDEKVKIKARFDPPKSKANHEVDLVIEVEVAKGWHVYGSGGVDNDPITFEAKDTFGIEPAGEVRTPEGRIHDYGGGIVQYWLEGKFELRQRMKVDEEEEEGELSVEGAVKFMVCDESMCLPPAELDFEATLEIVGEGEEVSNVVDITDEEADAGATAAADSESEDKEDKGIGWWGLILLAMGGGLFALAMPCTYPMIPITFSFFTKQADARGGKVLPLALTYGAGIILMFAAIGLCFGAITGFADGLQGFALHWAPNLIIGVAFVVFALSLFGFINLQPPQKLQDMAGSASSRGGLVGVFLMGFLLVVTSFTCTAPFVGLMIGISATGGAAKVVVGMAVFGLTMAIPFVFLAMMPGRVRSLPKAGEWMNTLKVTLGFVELAAALKFISNVDVGLLRDDFVITIPIFLTIWVVIFAITALYLLGVFTKSIELGKGRIAGAAFFLVAAGYSGYSMTVDRLDPIFSSICPPAKTKLHDVVVDDYPAALARAKDEDKLLLINFTGFN